MSQLKEWLRRACVTLGLRVEFGFEMTLSSGQKLQAIARISDLGAPNGMLLFRAHEEILGCSQMLLDAGFGYSILDEPRPDEQFDLSTYQEMFRDWGWSGKLGAKPNWMH